MCFSPFVILMFVLFIPLAVWKYNINPTFSMISHCSGVLNFQWYLIVIDIIAVLGTTYPSLISISMGTHLKVMNSENIDIVCFLAFCLFLLSCFLLFASISFIRLESQQRNKWYFSGIFFYCIIYQLFTNIFIEFVNCWLLMWHFINEIKAIKSKQRYATATGTNKRWTNINRCFKRSGLFMSLMNVWYF